MKAKLAIAVGSVLVAAAPAVLAQDNSYVPYPSPYSDDPRYQERSQADVYQYGLGWGENRWRDDWRPRHRDHYVYRDRDAYYGPRRECWNPRAGHFEEDRPGEYQDDLDYRRCRPLAYWR